jgi:hypothetical protein
VIGVLTAGDESIRGTAGRPNVERDK